MSSKIFVNVNNKSEQMEVEFITLLETNNNNIIDTVSNVDTVSNTNAALNIGSNTDTASNISSNTDTGSNIGSNTDNSETYIFEIKNMDKIDVESKNNSIENLKNEKDNIIIVKNENNDDNNKSKPKKRSSNFELLRIISMFLIVIHHFSFHGDMNFDTKKVTLNRLWVQFLVFTGKIGVSIFILISGYFLVNSKGVKINKLLKLELQMVSYSVLEYLIGVFVLKMESFDLIKLKRFCFPLTYTGYIRKYPVFENSKPITWFIVAFIIYCLSFSFTVISDFRAIKDESKLYYTKYLIEMNMVPNLLVSVCIFIGFTKLKFQSTIINFISATTFGIYLIHDHPFGRPTIWKKVLKIPNYTNSSYLIPYSIFSILAIFTSCSFIDAIRIYTIEKLYMKPVNYLSTKLDNLITKFNNSKISEKI
ncbi:hypothetical protein PIROE2DRAFT_3857 [Piromyces sp. E2]|nr:hypothetical protein PIROE2DRAFT_3857 [Piromyces sp. E2]|eukprot:OUM68412.1 hypothetical protein PIROE2DRAFT_3857 [Piromyces sp. E2]